MDIPKSKAKIRIVPKKKEVKQKFKFNPKLIKIEKTKNYLGEGKGYGEVTEIEYDDEKENVYIEFSLKKGKDGFFILDTLTSKFENSRPRARKGYTRAMLCHTLEYLINKGMITLKTSLSLIAGWLGAENHNINNLINMYEKMSFKKTKNKTALDDQKELKSTVEKVLKWCHETYDLSEKEKEEEVIESSEEEEEVEVTLRTFKPIKEIPSKFKKIWFEYMKDRVGYYDHNNQKDELEELERVENNFIKAQKERTDKSLSSKKQLNAVYIIGDIIISIRKDLNENEDNVKLYKVLIPNIMKDILNQNKKDKQDLKNEEIKMKKQAEKEIKEEKERIKKEEKEQKKNK